jgi:hypothetical protein
MRALQMEGVRCSCSRYVLDQAITQDVVTRSVAVNSQSCRSNLVVSIAQDRCAVSLYSMQGRPQHGHVTYHHGFYLHELTPHGCMRTRRVYYDHGLQILVLRRTTSVDVCSETKGRRADQPQEGFVVAKLLVGTPTPAGDSVSECISIEVSDRLNIGKTIRLELLKVRCIFCSIVMVACANNIRRRLEQLHGVCLSRCLHKQISGCTDLSIPPEALYFRWRLVQDSRACVLCNSNMAREFDSHLPVRYSKIVDTGSSARLAFMVS